MGMAASQARLLMLTSRLHDVELKAQQLQNAKLQLSTQQDAVYEDYQKALDATTLTGNFINSITGARSDAPITFSNLFSLGAATSQDVVSNGNNYILVDSRGRVVVEDEIAEGYNNYQSHWGGDVFSDNAYQFAWYMIEGQNYGHWAGGGNNDASALMTAMQEVFEENSNDLNSKYQAALDKLDEVYGERSVWATGNIDPSNPPIYAVLAAIQCDLSAGYTPAQKDVFDDLTNYFWSHYGQQVFNRVEENGGTNIDGNEYNKQEFDYYVRIYNAIQQHGGCISIEDFNGPDGSAATNSEWLTAMLQSGQMSIETVTIDNTGLAIIEGASVASESALTYTATTQIDKVAMAKAEAEYEHEMKVIDRKEQKIDLELKKIETERTAITKEYDSIKKVSDDNIDRTFGIFS